MCVILNNVNDLTRLRLICSGTLSYVRTRQQGYALAEPSVNSFFLKSNYKTFVLPSEVFVISRSVFPNIIFLQFM